MSLIAGSFVNSKSMKETDTETAINNMFPVPFMASSASIIADSGTREAADMNPEIESTTIIL